MIRFIDGPAAGVMLDCLRTPVALRAVQSDAGAWDALDQIDDVPRSNERIVVYRLARPPITGFICCRPRSKGGAFVAAEYVVVNPQPNQDEVRVNAKWIAWVESNRATLGAGVTP